MTTSVAAAPVDLPAPTATAPAKPRNRKAFIALAVVVSLMLVGVLVYFLATRGKESTDDAQVQADTVALAPRVGGTVQRVLVEENSPVTAGQPLLQLDDAEYAARVQQAEGELTQARAQERQAESQEQIVGASAHGGFTSAGAQLVGSSARVAGTEAQVAAALAGEQRADAQATNADTELQRATSLLAAGAITREAFDTTKLASDTAQAALQQGHADLAAAKDNERAANLGVVEAQGKLSQTRPVDAQIAVAHAAAALARGKVTAAQAALDLARLQLSYTRVAAPADGRVAALTARVAQILSPGQPFAEFVPNHTYVTANLKETQTGEMRAGQRAKITISAYGGRTFEGRVESLSAGTGAVFSLLPPNDATGNFVKVVQRVPVRIAFVAPPTDVTLRAGLSVDVTVYVR
jgi:membrane fusion protein (multidrug efflux system)